MTDELKPCPWCGETTLEIEPKGQIWRGQGYGPPQWFSGVHWCGKGFQRKRVEFNDHTEEAVVAAWNTRPGEARASNDALREAASIARKRAPDRPQAHLQILALIKEDTPDGPET